MCRKVHVHTDILVAGDGQFVTVIVLESARYALVMTSLFRKALDRC